MGDFDDFEHLACNCRDLSDYTSFIQYINWNYSKIFLAQVGLAEPDDSLVGSWLPKQLNLDSYC